jgi:hypothetical protein
MGFFVWQGRLARGHLPARSRLVFAILIVPGPLAVILAGFVHFYSQIIDGSLRTTFFLNP